MMRKLLSALLLAIFLFNVVGYYGVFWFAKEHASRQMVERIDADKYHREELITLKVPLSLPYPMQEDDFSRIKGSFEHHGEFYKLVKQKLQNDTLYMVCIKDHHETELHNTMKDFAKVSNDIPASAKTLKVLSSFAKDFQGASLLMMEASVGWCSAINHTFVSLPLLSVNRTVLSPPPRPLA